MLNQRFLLDGHADILYRMLGEDLAFYGADSGLQEGYEHMKSAGLDLQVFALYVGSPHSPDQQLRQMIRYLDMFQKDICDGKRMAAVYTFADIEKNRLAGLKSGLLSIEGGDCLAGDLGVLRVLHQLGVRAMGLTWNNSNSIADGVGAEQDHGLTPFGREVIAEMNRLRMVVDISHLAPKGFWDVIERTTAPIIASHSNSKAIHNHRRNLDDEQIKAIINTNGVIGVTFVPYFIRDKEGVQIDDLLRHVDHILALGGEDYLAIGSDFDGITETMVDLRNGSDFPRFIEALDQRYGVEVTRKIMGANFLRVLQEIMG